METVITVALNDDIDIRLAAPQKNGKIRGIVLINPARPNAQVKDSMGVEHIPFEYHGQHPVVRDLDFCNMETYEPVAKKIAADLNIQTTNETLTHPTG